jgi:hypothetical protein
MLKIDHDQRSMLIPDTKVMGLSSPIDLATSLQSYGPRDFVNSPQRTSTAHSFLEDFCERNQYSLSKLGFYKETSLCLPLSTFIGADPPDLSPANFESQKDSCMHSLR